jgi:hypothetical protein
VQYELFPDVSFGDAPVVNDSGNGAPP